MNLVYYMLVRDTEPKKRAELDRTLQSTTWAAVVRQDPVAPEAGPPLRGKKVPSWWKGDAAAAASTLQAAREHGYVVGQVGG